MDAIQYLLHLHSCEQEGISSGMPTPQQWIDAVEAARKQHAEQYSGGGWISVEDRLPELDEQVETQGKDGRQIAFFCRNAEGEPMWIVSFRKIDDVHIYTPISWRKLKP